MLKIAICGDENIEVEETGNIIYTQNLSIMHLILK